MEVLRSRAITDVDHPKLRKLFATVNESIPLSTFAEIQLIEQPERPGAGIIVGLVASEGATIPLPLGLITRDGEVLAYALISL